MKLILIYAIIAMLFTNLFNHTEIEPGYVRTQPATPIDFKTAAPGAGYLWIDGSWVWNKNNYIWKPGYWAAAPKNAEWISGRWIYTTDGYFWVRGKWKNIESEITCN